MIPSFRRPGTLSVVLLLLALVAMLLPAAGASADIVGAKEVPGYPKVGCYDVVVGGNGMWGGLTPYPITVDVPGPVVNAYLQWLGTEDAGSPDSPNTSVLSVNGTNVTGQLTDQFQSGPQEYPWYMWRADIGPSGANLVKQGVNKYSVSGWSLVAGTGYRQNGVSVVVVYETGACAKVNQVDLMDSFTWYWERNGGVSKVVTFTFPPAATDRDMTVWLHNGGAMHLPPTQPVTGTVALAEDMYSPDAVDPSACRGMNLWARAGSGDIPPTLVEYSNTPPTSAYGGKLVVTNPFVGANCPPPHNTTWTWPVTSLLGWVDGAGWTRDVGGYIAPEWSIIRITYRVRAGDTWLALQVESEKTGATDVLETGESGAWFAQAVIPLDEVIKLRVTKSDGLATAKPGDTLTYTINYENYGVIPAPGTTLVDTLPPNVTFVSASDGGTLSADGKTVNWNLGTLAGGAKGAVTLVVKADPVFAAGTTTLTNKVVIAAPGEPDTSDNTATDTTDIVAAAQLTIDKTGVPEPVAAGENLNYTINWTVGGNAFSQEVKVVDKLPANVTFVSASDAGTYDAGSGTITWWVGDVTPSRNGSYTVVVKANADLTTGTKITNVATITNKAGDSAQDTVVNTVQNASLISLTKTNNLAAGTKAQPGDQVIWTLGYSLSGTGTFNNVTITDPLPAEVDFVSASNGGTYDAGTRTVTWKLGNLPGGTNGSVTLTVKLKTPLTGVTQIVNTATIRDDAGNTDDATDTVPVGLEPVLSVTKTNNPTGEVKPGDTITYNVCMSNAGQANAVNAVLTDVIPVNTTYVAGSATGGATWNEATKTLTWKKNPLAPAEKVCGTFQVKVNTVITGLTGQKNVAMKFSEWNAVTIDNTATATADNAPSKSATVSNPLVATVNPMIYKSANKSQATVGDEIVFTLTVRNDGTATATNVVVTDGIPPKLDAVTATSTKGAAVFDPNTRVLTVTIGQMNPGETVNVTITGKAANSEQLPYTMTNEAVVSFTEGAPRTSNRVSVTVNAVPPYEIPEPGTWLMLGAGLAGVAGYVRVRAQSRRRK